MAFYFFSFLGMFPCLSRDDNIGEALCLVINKEANFKAEMCVGHMVYFFQAWGVFYVPKNPAIFFVFNIKVIFLVVVVNFS